MLGLAAQLTHLDDLLLRRILAVRLDSSGRSLFAGDCGRLGGLGAQHSPVFAHLLFHGAKGLASVSFKGQHCLEELLLA